jgi:hypothetical protein
MPSTASSKLENLIDERVQIADIISKTSRILLTFICGCFGFSSLFKVGSVPKKYLKRIEETIMSLVSLAL